MLVSKVVDKLCPVFFVEGFSNPALEGAKIVDSDFGNVGKEETEVLDDVVIGVKKRTSHWADIGTACCQHLLRWAIGGAHTIFPMKSICRAAIMLPTQEMS
jgi:hypothetical protein